ncbi:Protein of unknown function DUF3716 [Penicillium daleae]|uniref:Uncharacterized protein n=1 Tax=Penicillium daleae TaxID=63821 RepID=A0AAD6BYA3_9EURO|nr:Protein of unknown function DUF3716 [Penicillium daleae]KAJ5437961.1 Protein of unknown function DUF3716 [Penicillium daleae]
MTSRQEPSKEATGRCWSEEVDRMIGDSEQRLESAVMQATGNIRQFHASRANLIWDSCVVVDDIAGVPQCADCHWEGTANIFCFVAPLLANEVESDEVCFERIKTTLLDLKKRRAEMNPPLDRPDEYIDTLLAVFDISLSVGILKRPALMPKQTS